MTFTPRGNSPRNPLTGIENGNKLGAKPVVRQSKICECANAVEQSRMRYTFHPCTQSKPIPSTRSRARAFAVSSSADRERESGNAMKSIFGQDHLAWNTAEQEGVFKGHGVYDAATDDVTKGGGGAAGQRPAPQQRMRAPGTPGTPGDGGTAEYPNPGSVCACDACGEVVNRYYHCANCVEETGLFDLCTTCCGNVYLKRQRMQNAHPTHDFVTHQMIHITPPGEN